jgi:hypothetical protein
MIPRPSADYLVVGRRPQVLIFLGTLHCALNSKNLTVIWDLIQGKTDRAFLPELKLFFYIADGLPPSNIKAG